MIFVTVGTSDFDQLVERMDELAPLLHDQVVVQIGNGKYVPRNCEYFRFAPSLDPYYDKADLVVAHGGLGTTMEVLAKGKKLISVENTVCIDDHQTDILGVLAKEGHLIWCQDLDKLPSLLERAPAMSLRPYVAPPCRIAAVVKDFLGGIGVIPPAHHKALVMSEKASTRECHSRGKLLFRKWLRVIVVSITYYTGLALLSGSEPKVRILMYHSIDDDPCDVYSVSPTAFEEQMRFLATRYNVISLDQLIDYLNGKGALPDNPVVITFDDGLANNYAVAYPILKKYDLPATVFVVPDWIVPCEILRTDETWPDGKRYMTWSQIREMSHHRISVGAHTISHRSLPTLTLEEVRYELLESKARLEQQLGQPIKFFSYPYGVFRDLNNDIVRMVAESGYACAVTSLSGANGRGTNLYALKRTEIEVDDGMYVFSKAMEGALDSWIALQRLLWVSQILKGRLYEYHHRPHVT